MTLRLTCLGEFQITRNGEPFTAIPTDKVRALLVYLAVEGRVHTRSELVQLFWPGYTTESANNNLRQSLHRLRQLLHEDEQTPSLLTTRQSVQINPDAPIVVDVTTFTGLLAACRSHAHTQLADCPACLARLQQAVDLYQGDFLAGFTVADSDGFEEWRRITQEQLHLQTLDALALLAEAAEATGDDEGALQHARRQLVLESWLEAAHRRIMRILARRGQNAAAIAQYNRCRQVLAEEMGSEPETETTALYEQIRSGQFPTTRASERATPPPQRPATQRPEATDGPQSDSGSDTPPQPPVNQRPEAVKATPLSVQLPPLLGRDDELAQIATLLAHPNSRLVTLVGPPGVGKTRLAQALLALPTRAGALDSLKTAGTGRGWVALVEAKIQNRSTERTLAGYEGLQFDRLQFDHGIHFIDLSALRDPALLAATLAHALTTAEPALQLTGERLIEQLRDKTMLLVLDNCEQVLPSVALLGQLLAACPQIKVLATSRVPLHLPGEQVVAIHPLPLPDPTQPMTLAMAAQNVAVQLFCQRAAVAAPGFTLTERLAPVIAEICRHLDGLPLAIELAAARTRLLPPPALLERLTTALPARLEILSSGSSALPPRQQTLRAAIAWSYDLLNDAEQRLFRQLTVFVGGATLPAIEAVIGAGQSHSLFDSIESLIDKSLLRQLESPATESTPGADAEPRLVMLETLREYGWALLTASDSGHSIQQRHAEYFLTFAERAAPQLHGPAQVIWLDRLALDHDNLRAALDWLAQAGDLPKALRLATALRYFWRVRGHYREGRTRLQQLLARPEAAATGSPADTVRARALNAAGYLQWVQGNTAAAQSLLQEALLLGRAVPDPTATAFALRYLGLAADAQQDKGTARRCLEESLAIYRSVDAPNETALALMYLGDMALGQQAYDQAQQLYQESADLLRQLGNQVVLPYALRHLGYLALIRSNLAEALRLCTESLRLNLAAGEQQGSAAALSALAAVAVAGERWPQAARLLESVTAWLAARQARLLPFDHTYYTETQRLLHQHQAAIANTAPAPATAPLTLEQALAYVVQELAFDDELGRQEDKKTGRGGDKEQVPSEGTFFLSSPLPVFLSPVPPHNIPLPATRIVGRSRSLAEIGAHLQQSKTRLLTLVGPGGMGKTRLALEIGRQHLATFADGVWFIPLASISRPEALAGAIATALGLTVQGGDPRNTLLQNLRPKHLLLILDNFEHLLVAEAEGAVDLVVDLLDAAPGMQILVTSRERLNLRSEQIYAVPALSFAPNATLAEAEALAAVRLFVQAVQRVQADFQLTDANLATVLRICQLVQGMPLGLELAAANAGSAPLRAIADALEQNAEILAVEWRDLPARQRSMRAVFAWSWQLLSAAEQRILRQCAIFRGGFDYTAAQAVVSATPLLLTQLVNKSLLQWQAAATGEGRYTMHELLRQFAAEALAQSGERAAVEERHGRYYLAYLAARGFRLGRGEPKEASAEIQGELDNVRLAWYWAATQGGLAELDQAVYAWWQFCLLQGVGGEARQSLAVALTGVRTQLTQRADDAALRLLGERLLAKLLALHANFLFAQGRDAEMTAQARAAMQLGAASGGFEGEILGTYVLGRVLQDAGDQKRAAQALWEQTLQLIRHHLTQQPANELLHELHWMTHEMLRGTALHFGDYAGCRAHIIEALRICQTLGKQRGELSSLSCLGEINFFLYDFAAAEADYRAELALGRSLGYRQSEMSAQEGLARCARLRGDYAIARTLLEESLSTATELAFHYDEALFLAALIRLHCQLGDQTAADAGLARLTQLLAQVKLGKECQLYGYLAAAIKAHYAGDKDEALAAAEQANRINQQGGDILFRLVDTALILGHTRAAVGQWAGATAAFQEALAAFQQFGNHAVAAEPRAGLAYIALAQGDMVGALAQIEALLPVLAAEPHAGYNDPFFIYLTGYHVLVANGDPRAATLLQQGYDLLHQDAAALDNESRQRFLTAVPLHRELVEAYEAMQAQDDRVTSDKVTSTSSVTESPSHPVTLSPPHLVTQSPKHNLPATLTPFVGRTRSLTEIRSRLEQGARLLTLIGPGGTGKTRLAVEAGRQQVAAYPDGVWFVPLAALTNPDALAPAIATALNLSVSGGDLGAALAHLLQPKRLLLILDNFEQLLVESTVGAELVAALLQAAPGVQILVTSRERLRLRSEQLYQVPPLTVDLNATLDEATTASAARLFVQSAQFVQPNFQLTDANLATVLRICHLVQGMPLGLELAAAQVGSLPLAAIADAIAQSAEFLAVDWVDLPERQRSMRAVFAWSWRLLNEAEQRALRQLSIFRGGFTHEAAQAITGVTLPTLTRLVHCSLLSWEEQGTGGRYAIHEQLRQFAAEELTRVAPEEEQVTARYNAFYLHYLAAREARLTRAEPRAAAAEIQWELDNIRQAWQNTVQRLAFSALQRSAWALFSYYRHTGSSSEALQSFQALAEQILRPVQPGFAWGPRQPHDPPQSRFVAIYAYLLTLQSKLDQAIVVAQGALALAQAEEATDAAALSHLSWGQALRLQGRLAEAQPHLEQTLQLGRSVTDPTGKSDLLYDVECLAGNALGALASDGGNYQQAREHFGQSLHLAQSLGKRRLEINALLNLANLARMAGEYPAARQGYEDALRLTRAVGYRWGEGISQYELGLVLRRQGEYSHAATLLENVLLIFQEIGEQFRKGNVLIALGQLYAYVGDVTAAEGWLTRYQQFIDQSQVREATIHYLHACTALAFHREDLVQALAYATEGWQLGQAQRLPDIQAYGLIGIGHAQRQLGQVAAATSAYQQALALYTTLQRPDLAAEAQAGLAAIAQQQGDQRQALGLVEAVLAQLAEQPSSGQDEPFFLYLTCYQVLAAAQDARASTILEQGYHLLQRYAEQISDERLRQSFLANVPVHRALEQAYLDRVTGDKETRRQEDKETRRQEDKETGKTPPSLSPPLPVSLSVVRDWAEMPMVDFFVERTAEVAQLTAWLTPSADGSVPAQLISILGIGGMGKTTLAALVTKAIAPSFAVVIWRSLLNAPPLNDLLHNWLQILSRQSLTALPESLDEQLRLLLTYLQQERCLLVLDNVESIFAADLPVPEGNPQPQSRAGEIGSPLGASRAGVTRPGYEGYDQLFQRLASSDHQSCLLLTSREQPYALLRIAGSGRQAQTTSRVQVLPLAGLNQTAGQALLTSNGLHASATEAAQLIENYSGNPLALQIVAATIADFFGGDVAAFQQEEGQLFDGMRVVLDQQFARLSPLERDILLWLAIEREPVTVPMLRSNFVQSVATAPLLEALQALQNRSLLEKRDNGLTLQNVIIEYTTAYLVEQVCQEIYELRVTSYELRKSSLDEEFAIRHLPLATSFLNRFALLKAQAKEHVRHSQSRMIVQPVVARLLEEFGRTNVESNLRQQIERLKGHLDPAERGYAAGNLLNLLLHAGCDLTGCDLSGMAVWQAYLRECTLHDVNFAGTDLSGSKFADTFTAITTLTYSRDGKFLAAGTSLGDIRVWLAQTLQPIAMLQGHSRLIMGLAFGSAQRQLLASSGEDGALRLWNLAKPEEPSVILYQAPGFIRTVVVSPIADLVASAGDDPEIQLWDMQTRRAVAVLRGHSNIVTALAFSSDGRFLASCSGDHTVRLWDLSAIEQSAAPQPHPLVIEKSRTVYSWSPAAADVWQITISPNNQWLAGVTLDGMVWTWHIDAELSEKPVQVLQAQGAHQMAVSFSPDSSHLAVTASSGAIWLLDRRSGAIVRQIEGHKPLTLTLAFAPDGKTLASGGSDRTLRVWELPTGQLIQALTGAARAFRAAVFSADGKTIVTSAEDHTMRIWDVNESPAPESAPQASTAPRLTGFCRHVLRGHSSGIWTVALDHTCTVAASAGEDSNILLWDRRTGQQLHKFAGHLDTVTALAFSPDGRTLISGSPDQTVRLWDYRTFTPLAQLRDDSPSISTHEKSIWSVALSPDGALLAAGYSDGGIGIWDIRDTRQCRQIGKLRKHEGWVRTLAFSPDGALLASGSNDHTVRLWQVKTGSLQHVLHGHSDWVMSVAFHPHGNLLASGSFDSTIRLWNVATGKPIAPPAANTAPMRHDKGVVAVTFHPAGHLLLSASRDERMTFWHCATQQRLSNLVAPGPYSGLKIAGATGLSEAQKAALRALGAVDETATDEMADEPRPSDKVTSDKVTSDKMTSDKVTSDKVTSDKVTESPPHPVTLSPPHPVILPGQASLPLLDWAEMPMVDFFVERRAEVAQLTGWLAPTGAGITPARLVSILGMGGMGKTTLAAAVTKAVASSFAVVIWRSLLNAPPLNELVRNWLQVLSRQTLTALPDSLDEQLRLLLTYLQQERCLLVLDNVESIFATDDPSGQSQSRAGVTRPGYEGYDQLFQRLANSDHQSCLLLTSREQPYALLRSGRQAQTAGRVQVLPVAGLDQTAGQVLLASNGLHASAAEAAQLVENYSGNPLALQIVAATIADFFGGDVAAFQQEEGQLFDGMRLVLDQQFARLSPLEREILVWLAIEREAVTVPTLRSNFAQPVATAPLLEALQALQNRSLLEKRDAGFTLQNVIIEYTTEYLVEQVCEEILDFGFWILDSGPDASPVTIQNLKSKIQNLSLNRFALLKAQAKEYVRQSQARLILRPVADHLVATLDRTQLVARIPQLLDALRATGVQKGYAGGNLLNLLVHLGEDLIGYDFSRLPVWQANLSGLTFVTADFTGADLSRSTFTAGITVDCVAFQPTGELWVAGIRNGVLGLWRTVEGQLSDAFQRKDNLRGQLAFSPQGEFLATNTDDYRIHIWSTTSGECLQTLAGQQSTISTMALSADGTRLATWGSDHTVCLWDRRTGRCVQRLPGYTQGVDALAFSPDGQLLATGGGDGQIQLWDTQALAEAGRRVVAWPAHRQSLGALAFSPDGRWLASGSHSGEIQLWQIVPLAAEQNQERAGEESAAPLYRAGPHCLGHTSIIRALLFLPTAEPATYLLASAGADRTVRLWSLTGQLRYTLLGHTNAVYSLSASPDGRQLASAGTDKQIFLWDVATGQALHSQQAYRSALQCLTFSPDGQMVASGGADHIVRLWQVDEETSQLRHALRGHTHFIISVAFSPDGQIVASGDADRTIRLWDRTTGQALQTLREHQGSVRALAFAPTPSHFGQAVALLASAGADRIIRLWSVALSARGKARCERQLIGHEDEILALTFDPQGRHLVSGCADGTIRIWDIQSGATTYQLTGHTAPVTAIAINRDDGIIATSCFDQTIRLWDLTTGACLHVARGAQIGAYAVTFSPDGQYLAYTGNDLAIYLWPWRTYAAAQAVPPDPLRGHVSTVYDLRFNPTTGQLASCSIDGRLRLWDVASRRCTQVLRPPGPYASMKITGVTGISEAQKAALRALGAVEE